MTHSSQKFIARNRAPRVQIEYDVELYGSEKKVQLPFVMGVMSDLSGKSKVEQPSIADRSFLEIDVDNFDDRMRAMQPRAAFSVPNTLTGEGNIAIDLTFEKMDDFSPAAIAAKVEPLRPLLEARTQLSTLMAYMDGKAGAETLIEKILADPALLSAVSGAAAGGADQAAALDSLRALTPTEPQETDTSGDVLDALKAQATADVAPQDRTADVLSNLAAQPVAQDPEPDTSNAVFDGLRQAEPAETPTDTAQDDALAALRSQTPQDQQAPDTATQDALAALAANTPQVVEAVDTTSAVLDSLADLDLPEAVEGTTDDLLAELASAAPEEASEPDTTSAALDSLAGLEVPEVLEDTTDDLLAELAESAPESAPEPDDTATALDSLADIVVPEDVKDTTDDLLADLASAAPEETSEPDTTSAALDSLAGLEMPEVLEDTTDELLAGLADAAPEETPDTDTTSAALDSLADLDVPETVVDTTDELLAGLADAAPEETPDTDTTSAALDSLADLDVPEAVEDTTDDLLAELAESAPEAAPEPDDTTTALDSLADLEIPAVAEDTTDDLLADLADAAPVDAPESNAAALALDSLADLDVPEVAEDTTDDLLAELADAAPAATPELDEAAAALDSLADLDVPQVVEDTTDALLADLADTAPEVVTEPDIATAALDSLADLDLPEAAEDKTDDLLADLADAASQPAPEVVDVATAALDSLVDPETPDDADPLDDLLTDDAAVDDLDDLLGDLGSDDDATPEVAEAAPEASDLDDLLADDADIDDLDDLLGDLGSDDDATPEVAEAAPEASDLDDLLADDADIDDLDDLLGDLGSDDVAQDDPAKTAAEDDGLDDLDDLLGDLSDDTGDDLDNLLGDLGDSAAADDSGASLSEEPEFAYGQLSADRPSAERLNRKRFRLAILGDFSGRAARGQLEIGDALAARKPILLDPDTVEDVIEGFATDLVLPIGKNGSGVAIKLGGLDDLHPDELYENVEIFAELVGLRGQLNSGATAENAARQLRAWGEEYDTPVAPTRSRSSGNSVPADLKLSDFQKLIGDTQATLTQASPLDELMAQIVGPHIRAIPDADTVAMKGAVDQALSAAMRLVLHHPEFQSIEAQWRSLDLIARSIEDDDTLDVMLYDVSAEEIGADLATADDLGQSGLVRLLTDGPLDEDNGRGGYSALIGLYTFEETPPHAELLGRIARVAAHVDAPFIAAITPTFLDTDKADRHPLVANAWDTLRGMPEAGHLALASPRFLLRQPYGAKSEPIYEFEFEEFTMSAGLRGMLWANPVVLVAILLAKSFRENGASMGLGSIMSLGGMPFYFVNDRYGDQVALPCTERNLTLDKVEQANGRGIMSVVSIKGRDEIRLASFNSLAGAEILGPWTGVTPPPPSPPKPKPAPAAPETVDSDAGSGDDSDLDDLLADFGDDLDFGGDDDDTDADLAALLADL